MPSPSRSNLTSPIVSQPSLSHCRTVRPGIRARSIGQTSPIGRSVSTMPPEWMPRWRGADRSSSASDTTCRGISDSASTALDHPSTDLLHASCCPVEKPSALAASRTAIRGR